jgi:hypothetical protein
MHPRSGSPSRSSSGTRRSRVVFAPLVLAIALLALPASAQALSDVGVTETVSTHVVKPGGLVTVTATVKNFGTEPPPYGNVYVELDSLADHAYGADAPYRSANPSVGSCNIQSGEAFGTTYHYVVCDLGALAPDDSAQITATMQVNQSIHHGAVLLPSPYEGGYTDDKNSNNASGDRIAIDKPPTITGSKKLKLQGVPNGCFSGDFTLRAVAKGTHVKKMMASIYLGLDEIGDGQFFKKVQNGTHLVAKIPVSQIFAPLLAKEYVIHVKAKRAGRKPYEALIAFTVC